MHLCRRLRVEVPPNNEALFWLTSHIEQMRTDECAGQCHDEFRYLRRSIETRQESTDFHTIASTTDVLSEIIVQVAIIDAKERSLSALQPDTTIEPMSATCGC